MERLPVVDLADLLKTPPLPTKVRRRAGYLLRKIQNGEVLTMPDSRPMPSIGSGVNELRLTDQNTEWRVIYRIDPDALIAVDAFLKKTRRPRSE